MSERCTLSMEEQKRVFTLFDGMLTAEEEEQVSDRMTKYVFYHNERPSRRCYCTVCGGFEARGGGWKHNGSAHCPSCGAAVVTKSYGRLGSYRNMRERHNFVFFRRTDDGALLVSAGEAVQTFYQRAFDWLDNDAPSAPVTEIYPEPEITYYERRRYYLAPGKIMAWKRWAGEVNHFGIHYYESETPWTAMKTAAEPFPRGSYVAPVPEGGKYYCVGLDCIDESVLRYSAIDTYFDSLFLDPESVSRNVISYLTSYCIRPQLELLTKLGHTDVIDELIDGNKNAHILNWKAKKPNEFFRMSRQDYRYFMENEGNLSTIRLYRENGRLFGGFGSFMQAVGGVNPNIIPRIREASELIGETLPDTLRKLRRESLNIWLDYIDMGIKLNLDFSEETVRHPKNLLERHDQLVEMLHIQKREAEIGNNKAYLRRYSALRKKYCYEAFGLCIVVPQCQEDIITEGKLMHHCVGGYAPRHMSGVLDILFLRDVKNPQKPLATIEMNGMNMVQIRGAHNDRNTTPAAETYREFTDQWLAWIRAGSLRDAAGNPIQKNREVKTA